LLVAGYEQGECQELRHYFMEAW